MTDSKVGQHGEFQTRLAIVTWYLVEAFRIFLEPLLCHLNLMTPNFGDATYGRASLPRSQDEKKIIFENPEVTVHERVIHLKGEAIRKGGSWNRPGSNFVAYSTWQIDEAMKRESLNADIGESHLITQSFIFR